MKGLSNNLTSSGLLSFFYHSSQMMSLFPDDEIIIPKQILITHI